MVKRVDLFGHITKIIRNGEGKVILYLEPKIAQEIEIKSNNLKVRSFNNLIVKE